MKYSSFILVAAILVSSCTLATGTPNGASTIASEDQASFQKAFMSSYYSERSGAPGGVAKGARALTPFASREPSNARATVPLNKLSNLAFGSIAPLSLSDYPEPGQTTSFTASLVSGTPTETKVYKVLVTTIYPSTDSRASYIEEYFVQDIGLNASTGYNSGYAPDGTWTVDDPIVKQTGGAWAAPASSGYLAQDQASRTLMRLSYRDGSTRNETIVASSLSGGPKFDPAAFSVTGSLDMSDAFIPASSTSSKVLFSSVVMYYVTPAKAYNYWFWSGTSQQSILGIRYYTEVADPSASTYAAYTASFEKTLDTLTTAGGSFASTFSTIHSGSISDVLAESVLRQELIYSLGSTTSGSTTYYVASGKGAITTNMKTRVVNISGGKDFYLSQLNSDFVTLSSWSDSTIYVPTGNATEILAGDASANLFSRAQQITPAAGTLPFAVKTTDLIGSTELATLYGSITEGTATAGVSNTPSSTIMSSGTQFNFNGQQAVGISTTSSLSLASAGTVEAWVYVNVHTDTAGVVHKGVAVDFSDECFSLQGWGSAGQIAIVLDAPGSGNSYDLVTSKTKLNTKKWYYLTATWDVATKKIYYYLNGVQDGSGAMSVTKSGVRDNASAIILGSQLPTIYSSSAGYFGLNGRIVAADIGASALSAAEVKAKYEANKAFTAYW